MSIANFYSLVVTDPKLLEHILTSTKILSKGTIYQFTNNWLGTGLLTAPGMSFSTRVV